MVVAYCNTSNPGLVKRRIRRVGSITIIGMLFSSASFMLESVNPDIAYGSTLARECLERLKHPSFTSSEYYQCEYEQCISSYADTPALNEMCSTLVPSTVKFCPGGDIDFGIACQTSVPKTSTPQQIFAKPPLLNWDKLCTTRNYSTNIGTAAKPELHDALDIPVPGGTPVLAPMDGTVVMKVTIIGKEGRTGYQPMGGNVLYIITTDGFHLFDFGHLQNGSLPSPGKTVKAGDQIALSGNTGTATKAPHLHFSYHTREKDPITNEWTPFTLQDPFKVVSELKSCKT